MAHSFLNFFKTFWKWYVSPHSGYFSHYSWSYLIGEVGLACFNASLVIPGALAFASLAGLHPMAGLLSAVFPGLFYVLLGSSKTMSVGRFYFILYFILELLIFVTSLNLDNSKETIV